MVKKMIKSTRPAFKTKTIQSLFAKSGNRCAFENCLHELVTEKNLFVGQICHIEGFSPKGPRFNPNLNENSRECENLILLCYKHHRMVDYDPIKYDVATLKLMKNLHESKLSSLFVVDDDVLKQAEIQEKRFWDEIENINKNEHPYPEMAVDINTKAPIEEILYDLKSNINDLEKDTSWLCDSDSGLSSEIENFLTKIGYNLEEYKKIPYYQNPFENRNWESHNLAIPNMIIRIRLALLQLEIKYLELYLKKYPKDHLAKTKFIKLKEEMKEWAKSCLHD